MAPGAAADYKPGVAALYRDLGIPCMPMATNSGVHWPAHGFLRRPGAIVYEFLPAIPPGCPAPTSCAPSSSGSRPRRRPCLAYEAAPRAVAGQPRLSSDSRASTIASSR